MIYPRGAITQPTRKAAEMDFAGVAIIQPILAKELETIQLPAHLNDDNDHQ